MRWLEAATTPDAIARLLAKHGLSPRPPPKDRAPHGQLGTPNSFGLVQGEVNRIEPNKRMLSSMTPTIILKDGEVRAVLGSPGGSTISTTVLQLTRALVDYDISLDRAVPAPRAHHQWLPDSILVEGELPEAVRAELEKLGHKLTSRGRIGHANCIEVDPKTHGFRAVADTTRTGQGRSVLSQRSRNRRCGDGTNLHTKGHIPCVFPVFPRSALAH